MKAGGRAPAIGTNATITSHMTRADRADLQKVAQARGKQAKAHVDVYAKQLRADFEEQLSAIYSFDQEEVWKQAVLAAAAAVKEAQREADEAIAARCEELGIPAAFRPSLNISVGWSSRGENLVNERRVELRRKAETRIAAVAAEAKAAIDAAVLNTTTELLVSGLSTDEARKLAELLPTVEELMPPIDIRDLKSVSMIAAKGESRNAYWNQYEARRALEARNAAWLAEAGLADDE